MRRSAIDYNGNNRKFSFGFGAFPENSHLDLEQRCAFEDAINYNGNNRKFSFGFGASPENSHLDLEQWAFKDIPQSMKILVCLEYLMHHQMRRNAIDYKSNNRKFSFRFGALGRLKIFPRA
jgi:hypothetical protein